MSAFGNIKIPLPELWAYEKRVGKVLFPCVAVCAFGTVAADFGKLHSISHLFDRTGHVKEAFDFFRFHLKDGFEAFMFSLGPAQAGTVWANFKSKGMSKLGITYNQLRKAILIPHAAASAGIFVASVGVNLIKRSHGFDWPDMGCETLGSALTLGAGFALAHSVRPARPSAAAASSSSSNVPAGSS